MRISKKKYLFKIKLDAKPRLLENVYKSKGNVPSKESKASKGRRKIS